MTDRREREIEINIDRQMCKEMQIESERSGETLTEICEYTERDEMRETCGQVAKQTDRHIDR